MKKILALLLLVFFFGVFLRFYKLGVIPDGFHVDEAYLAYNSYSILNTGREMTGNLLPLNLKSFLYSPAGYTYFSIPFILIFGLSEFSARFASAFFGAITVPMVFLLSRKMFEKQKFANKIGLFSAFFLAISPWHINLSRVSTDNVLVVFFITLGTFLFLKWLDERKMAILLFSMISFSVTVFTYHASRSFLPLFVPLLFIYSYYRKKINIKKFILPLVFFILLIIIPVLIVLKSPELSFRIKTLSIFQNPSTQLNIEEQIREDGVMHVNVMHSRLVHNKITNYFQTSLHNYSKHFSFDFFFTDLGLPLRYKVSNMGLLYIFELPLLLFGLFELFKRDKKIFYFISGWIMLSPVGSALTFDDVPNLQRTLIFFPALSILSAAGLISILNFIKNKRRVIRKASYVVLSLVILYNIMIFVHAYFINNVVHKPWYRNEGFREMVKVVNENLPEYEKVVITDWQGSPTIFLLFYSKYNPTDIQQVITQMNTQKYGSMPYENYEISTENCPLREEKVLDKLTGKMKINLIGEKNTLYVNDGTCKVPIDARLIREIKRADGTIAFKILTWK